MPKDYIEQVLVQMYGSGKKEACIVAYGLLDDDYKNYFNEIDKSRLSFYEVEYDERFIKCIDVLFSKWRILRFYG